MIIYYKLLEYIAIIEKFEIIVLDYSIIGKVVFSKHTIKKI